MSGYTDCPCRDCFEIAMNGDLCIDCEDADCDASGESECNAPHAYEQSCDDPECCPTDD